MPELRYVTASEYGLFDEYGQCSSCCDNFWINYYTEGRTMSHRMYSIEVRIDVQDDRKHEAFEKIVREYAVKMHAAFGMLRDHQRPQVTVYAHDHTRGHVDIPLRAEDVAVSDEGPQSEEAFLAKELAEALK